MMPRFHSSLTGTLLLFFALSIAPVQAQDWSQEVQIITTVGYGESLQTFADSLSAVLSRNPDVLVQRRAKGASPIPASQLREQLYAEGIDVSSATHALIRYKFELNRNSAVVETIKDLHFIYRESDSQADLSILYLDTRDPFVNNFIQTQGIPSLMNMEVVDTFRKKFAFPYLSGRQETAMIEISGRSLRGYTVTSQQRILEEFLSDHLDMGRGSYVLALPEPRKNAAATGPSDGRVAALPEGEE